MKRLCRAALTALALVIFAGAAKINTPRVLLPWLDASRRVNFTFEISEGGCYTWSLSRDDLVSLEALHEDTWGHCSRSAVVTPLPACSLPGSVIILAEDVVTGEVIRGDVNVDRISSVKIMSTTWKLYLEEAPEAFEVEVFDEQGNKFSSLEGVEFNWRVENKDNKDEEPVVKLVWWRDTDYEAPRGISELESTGRRSYSVLLYAETMGEAKVVVCLNSTCDQVALRVVPSVVLYPAIAIMALGDAIRFKVVRAKKGKLTTDDVGDTVYRLSVPDDGVTYLEDGVSLVQSGKIGTTSISLISGSVEVASSSITVSEAHSIRVIIRPSELLVRGEPFVVRALVLDKKGRALTAGEKLLVRLSVEGEADVQLLRSTENGTLTDAYPNTSGAVTITAYLHSIGGRTLTQKIEGSAEAVVVEPLQIVPPELLIAWTDTPIETDLQHVGGGTGAVTWSVEVTGGQISVGTGGRLRAESLGHATVRAHLSLHPHVRASAEVRVLPAATLRVGSSGRARVGRPHYIHVALTAPHPDTGRLFSFHKCDCSSFDVTIIEGPEIHNLTAATWIEPIEGACCVLGGLWRERGASEVRVWRGRAADTARVLVRDCARLVWPAAAAMLQGSSLPVLAAGEALHARTADSAVADIRQRPPPAPFAHPDLQTFTLTCLGKGETSLELKSHTEDEDVEGGGSAAVACAPRAARIRLDPPAGPDCPGGPKLWIRAGGSVRVHVTLIDAAGRELMDEIGHKVSWETTPSHSGLKITSPNRLLVETDPEYEPVPVPLRYYQEVGAEASAAAWVGAVRARAGDASATLQTSVVSPLVATPQFASVAFEAATGSHVTSISGGSGRYTVEVQRGATATLDGSKLVAVWPGPGRYEFRVSDGCLGDETVTVVARVEEIHSVEISGPSAICVSTCVDFTATAYSSSGRALSSASPPQWRVTSGAELRDGQLCAVKEGAVTLKAEIGDVWSREMEVVVFPVLSIRPERVRLSPGARLQLAHSGGPPARLATFHYAALHGHDALVQPHGLVTAVSVGSGRVRLVAKDRDGAEIAHAEADVEIVGVSGVRAVAATHTLLVGEEAPLWLEGAPDLPAEALAALQPQPAVTWQLRDPSAATLTVPHRATQSMDRSTAEGLSVRLVPLREGAIIVDVHVQNFIQGSETRTFDTTVELLAIPELRTSVDGITDELDSSNVAIAVGATVKLRSSLKARWYAVTSDEPAFEISSSGEIRGLRPGFGVAIGRYRDEKNNFERETSVQIEVGVPHYMTTQAAPSEDGTAVRVEARSRLGRRLHAHNLTLTSSSRVNLHRITEDLVQVTGVEASGTFVYVGASVGAATLRDYFWLDPPDRVSERIVAGGGQALCLPGGGWRGAEGVWAGERGGVTLVVLQGRAAAKLTIRTDLPPRSALIVQSPVLQMEFLPGDWPAALVPLSIRSEVGDATIDCTDEERNLLADIEPVLPYTCVATEPYVARPVLDIYQGKMGCSVSSVEPVIDAQETDVCAEWETLRTCTKVLLLPPLRLTADRIMLSNRRERITITGHPLALKSVTVTSSPGIKTRVESSGEGLAVSVWSEDRECGNGWVWVRARRTAQTLRILVSRECDATCGSLLAIAVSLIRPYVSTLVSATLAACGALYLYGKILSSSPISAPKPSAPFASPLSRPVPLPSRTASRSPYAPPRLTPTSPSAPVYGDTTILSDNSYSPNSSQLHSTQGHSPVRVNKALEMIQNMGY